MPLQSLRKKWAGKRNPIAIFECHEFRVDISDKKTYASHYDCGQESPTRRHRVLL